MNDRKLQKDNGLIKPKKTQAMKSQELRRKKGKMMFENGKVVGALPDNANCIQIESDSTPGCYHYVNTCNELWSCTCIDARMTGFICKHKVAVNLWIGE